MKWIEAKVEFVAEDSDSAADLIAAVFFDLGLKGVLIEDPKLEPEEKWGDIRVGVPEHHAVIGFMPRTGDNRPRCDALKRKIGQLRETGRIGARVRFREIAEEDWAESWKKYFKPQRIARDMIVKPSWERVDVGVGTIVIDIDPGMAFGTGTHATTILCLRLIRSYLRPNDAFLDVGAGSGILSIAAAKLGAGSIWAVDCDESALMVTADNFTRNAVAPGCYRLVRSHLVQEVSGKFDMVAANILTDTVLDLLDELPSVLKVDGFFICSGIIERHRQRVLTALERQHFEVMDVKTLDNWLGIAARRC